MNWFKKYFTKNNILNVLWIGAPVATAIVTGGFTLPVVIAAAGSVAGKMAVQGGTADAVKAVAELAKAIAHKKNGNQIDDSETPKR